MTAVNVRGPILSVGETRTVSTSYGDRELRELRIRPTAAPATRST